MSGIGASDVALSINRTQHTVGISGSPYFKQTLNLTLAGYSPSTLANIAVMLFRPDNTLCATAEPFEVSNGVAISAMETNTTPIASIMATIGNGVPRLFTMRIYDGATTEKIAENWLRLRGIGADSWPGSDPTPPIEPGVNAKYGNLAYNNGRWYGLNEDDNLWYPVGFSGPGGAVQIDVGGTGIVIP